VSLHFQSSRSRNSFHIPYFLFLSRTEREQRVIELYQQGKTIREIAHEVHMSFGDIGDIVRKVTGPEDDNNNNNNIPLATLYKDSQAFALFSDGKKPIEVAIKWILELM
jgi:hypothetical protein